MITIYAAKNMDSYLKALFKPFVPNPDLNIPQKKKLGKIFLTQTRADHVAIMDQVFLFLKFLIQFDFTLPFFSFFSGSLFWLLVCFPLLLLLFLLKDYGKQYLNDLNNYQ